MSIDLVSTKEADYLEQDPPIRGQKYCCLSFISPEDVIKNKEVYFMQKFLKSFSTEMIDMFEKMNETFKEQPEITDALQGIKERYNYVFDTNKLDDEYNWYKAQHSDHLESDYLAVNNFQTSIRGIKVRGSYESLKEAQLRAQVLKRMDDKFHVFVAEVGCWCPWSPNPEELDNQEYAETHLNTLVQQYKKNQDDRDQFFLERKETLKQKAVEDNERYNERVKKEKEATATENVEEINDKIQEDDPWLQRKKEQALEKTEETTTEGTNEGTNEDTNEEATETTEVVAEVVTEETTIENSPVTP